MAAHKSRKDHCLTVARLHDLVHKIMGVHEDDRLAALVPHRRRVRRVSDERLRGRPRGTRASAAADDDMRRGTSEGHQRAPRPDDGRGLAIFVCKASDIHAASATRPAKCAATAASWRGRTEEVGLFVDPVLRQVQRHCRPVEHRRLVEHDRLRFVDCFVDRLRLVGLERCIIRGCRGARRRLAAAFAKAL